MKALVPALVDAKPSALHEIAALARNRPNTIRLEVGEPNFPTPAHIREAGQQTIERGELLYVSEAGLLELREKLVAKLQRINHYSVTPEEITVTVGGAAAISNALTAILQAGDEALIPDPGWPNYATMVACCQATAVPYPLSIEQAFVPSLDGLEKLVTPRTKLLIINSPANPTGAVYQRQTIEQLVDFCARHDLYLLSDECYDQIIYEGEHVSPASLVRDERIISAYTFSKTYAMTGWRVGYVVANASLTKAIRKIIEGTTSCVSPICQRAAEAALTGPQQCVDEMRQAYQERRDIAVEILKQHNMLLYRPQGAFYIIVDINHFGLDSRRFALDLLQEQGIAVAPGIAFGQAASCFVRVSLASSPQYLQVGLSGLCEYIQSHP